MSKFLRALGWTLAIAAVLVGVGRLTVIRWWQIPVGDPYLEASLAPTLRGGDWVVLWRGSKPDSGALVLCPEPKAANRLVIARLIGEKGDRVQLAGGALTINGRAPDTETGCDRFEVTNPATHEVVQQNCRNEVIAGQTHLRGDTSESQAKPSDADVEVPLGQVFLVSDNRLFPWDSREFGPVPRETCRESVVFRLVSKDGFFDVANRLTLIR